MNQTPMTTEKALQLIANVCSSFRGLTIKEAYDLKEALDLVASKIFPKTDAHAKE